MVKPPFTHRRSDAEHSPTLEICSSLAISRSRHSSEDASTFPLSLVACFLKLGRRRCDGRVDASISPTVTRLDPPRWRVLHKSSCFTRQEFRHRLLFLRFLLHRSLAGRAREQSPPRFTRSWMATNNLRLSCMVQAGSSGSTRGLEPVSSPAIATPTLARPRSVPEHQPTPRNEEDSYTEVSSRTQTPSEPDEGARRQLRCSGLVADS